MRTKVFLGFVAPSVALMVLFIALPIASIVVQSLHVEHPRVLEEVETCSPFGGCTTELRVDTTATDSLREAEPLGRFAGLETYLNRNHLASAEIGAILRDNDGPADVVARIYDLPFYKALAFTLAYTFLVTPIAIVAGFFVALGVTGVTKGLRGPVIFMSLLPYIVTPLIGALIIYWMTGSDGIIGATLQVLFDDPGLHLRASPVLTWITLIVYGIWHMTPFAFVVFYAGLQTVPSDTLESAMIDGANRWEQIRYVVIPHLAPLVTFIALILLMDNFRVLEPIVSFQAEAHATSLSWAIYNDLYGQADQLFASAAATSVLTTIGVAVLLMPSLLRTWRSFRERGARS
ncbi:sugar ABC transporter permease [Jannaschia sp. LMIT008]|uniref:carbohydrate ABC transporter permease n=1 Tax=Jannaschia maritima TaxID=3032585 RepID=UPI00281217B6|nr:sugar ABC transporter permease [Jannaschia sp. LMIT008]